ncbi:hypothetical protein R6Q59_028043 [Mikania micrantha]
MAHELVGIIEADNEKEPEIQIGAPTEVKHVAHIGCDGPSSNAPTWMNEFQGSSNAGSSNSNGGSAESMRTPDRHGKSKQSKKQAANETSHGRRSKNPTSESESPSQKSGQKKNRRKKRPSTRDSSSTTNVE